MTTFLLFLTVFFLVFVLSSRELPNIRDIIDFFRKLGLPAIIAATSLIVGSMIFMSPLAGIPLAVLGWQVTKLVDRRLEVRTKRKIRKQAQDFITAATSLYMAGQMTVDVVAAASRRIPDPLATELVDMLGARSLREGTTFPEMFYALHKKYGVREFAAIGNLIAAGENRGGPKAIGQGFSRLGDAIRRLDRLMAERAKGITEPAMAAWFVVIILSGLSIIDATLLRDHFDSFFGRLTMGFGVLILAGLFLLIIRLSRNADLE